MSADEMQPDEIGELLRRKVESEQSGKRVAVDVVGKIVAIQFDYFPGWVSELPRAEAETDNLRRIVETLEPKDPYDAIEFVRALGQAVRPSRSQLHRNGPEVEDDQLVVLQYAREVGPQMSMEVGVMVEPPESRPGEHDKRCTRLTKAFELVDC